MKRIVIVLVIVLLTIPAYAGNHNNGGNSGITKKINKVNKKHTDWNEEQDDKISNNTETNNEQDDSLDDHSQFIKDINNTNDSQQKQIDSNTKRSKDNSRRISEIEETQYIVGGRIRVYDGKKWQVNTFADYSTNRKTFDRVGVRFQFKAGKSYEEKRIDKLEKRIEKLMEMQKEHRRVEE